MTVHDSIAFVETPPEIVELMISLISKPLDAIVLDAGCGRGIFVNHLLSHGYECVEGVEYNQKRYEYCIETYPDATFYHDDFLSWAKKKYDIIIGNPPYMHYNDLPPDIQRKVTEITNSMESDIYYAFILRSIDMLVDDGELIFIVPYGFFYNTYADRVRNRILRRGYLDTVIDLDESRLFKDNHPETVIFKFVKSTRRPNMRITRIKTRVANPDDILKESVNALINTCENDLFTYNERVQFKLYDTIWSTHPHVEIPEYRFLEHVSEVNVGFLAGYSEGFSLTDDEYRSIPPSERDIIFPFVKSKFCKGFWVEGTEWRIIADGIVSSEHELKKSYPHVYQYLLLHKPEMSDRYLPNLQWFNWLALRNKSTIDKYLDDWKIFIPTLDRHEKNRFSMTKKPVYAEGDTVFIVPTSINPFFLLGYLNSDFFRNYYKSHGARRGHRTAYTQAVLSRCKIPHFQKHVVKEIIDITRNIFKNKDQSRRSEIDEIITRSFRDGAFRKVGITKFFSSDVD